ncbi:hypothetical protein HJC23_008020 [Cyclotella cryptica]|uniref:MgtC/SapB/SrpB/YhiD N-terminal domain-containing protein n=1 Tax=Cyclotella cryptica TaxID=29204 RepID=A0ABD3Q3Y7_9STRA|eukprot:CCRYP_009126-RA/>CCRYP_009126-RA protein AED:0.00 eAED:0.00 QI:585/-1/1/1/-1/1/1/108/418
MVQSTSFLASVFLLLGTAESLTSLCKCTTSIPFKPNHVTPCKPKYVNDPRSHGHSNSRLTSTYVEARHVSKSFLSYVLPRRVLSSFRGLSNALKKRGPQRVFLGTLLAAIMVFGPAFSPAANAATSMASSSVALSASSASVFSTQSRALGTFHFLPTKAELELCFRLLYAACSGAFVGLERSSHDRPAGVRTMALVGLGACIFTVCSVHGFLPHSALGYAADSPMLANVKCDPGRMASNVASGVGFIGAGAIHKSKLHGNGSEAQNVVAGLTTAAAIWVSAAVGVASAVGLYFVGAVASLSTVAILRFAKVSKEEETKFSWTPRALEVEDDVVYPRKKHSVSEANRANDASQARLKGLFGYNAPDRSLTDQILENSTMDPQLEQYLRRRAKDEGYSRLEQDIRIVESRVHQDSSPFKP